jgi:ADP-heptose:LPS heptosyltransferase
MLRAEDPTKGYKNPSPGVCARCACFEAKVPVGNLVIRNMQGAGDQVLLTAVIRDLHKAYPRRFRTWVECWARPFFDNNPFVEKGEPPADATRVTVEGFAAEDDQPHLITHWTRMLGEKLNLPIPTTMFCGDIHLSLAERRAAPPIDGDYWLIWAGGHMGFTTKWWNPKHWQAVVAHYKGALKFVQVGAPEHFHPRIEGAEYWVGGTSGERIRELVRLMHHAQGVISGISFGMHLSAAVPTAPGAPTRRPAIVIAGGRESPTIFQYPGQTVLHNIGSLRCCRGGACWKNKAHTPDFTGADCEQPVTVDPLYQVDVTHKPGLRLARCMNDITPEMVIDAINRYRRGIIEGRMLDAARNGAMIDVADAIRPICHACPNFLSDARLRRGVRCTKARPCCGERDVGTVDLTCSRCPEGKWDAKDTPEWKAYLEKEAQVVARI